MRSDRLEIEVAHDGALTVLRLPGGALDARAAAELAAAAHRLTEDRSARAVVLSSTEPTFCSGADPGFEPTELGEDPAAALARIRVPVIAAVDGRCRSVGLELALACDVIVATETATFALDDVVVDGRLPCWGGTQRLPRAIGAARASAMVLLGEELDATAAQHAGLAWRVTDAGEPVEAAAIALAEKLLALGPLALELGKEAVHRGAELPLRDGLRLEGDLNTLLAASQDRAEGLAAFFAKRPADFAGR